MRPHPTHKVAYVVKWCGAKTVLPLLSTLLPYLHTKKKQAQVLLDGWAFCGKGNRVTPLIDSQRVELKLELQRLKRV